MQNEAYSEGLTSHDNSSAFSKLANKFDSDMTGFWAYSYLSKKDCDVLGVKQGSKLIVEIIEDTGEPSDFINELRATRATGLHGIIDATNIEVRAFGVRLFRTNYIETTLEGRFEVVGTILGISTVYFTTGEAYIDSYSDALPHEMSYSSILKASLTMNSLSLFKPQTDFEFSLNSSTSPLTQPVKSLSVRSSFTNLIGRLKG